MMKASLNKQSLNALNIIERRGKTLLGDKTLSDFPLDKARNLFQQLLAPNHTLPDINIDVTNNSFSYDGINVKLRFYRPCGDKKFLPALIFFHGGGFVFGDLELIDYSCRLMADKLQCIIVSVDYRKAPEFKFPAAHNDCYQAVKYVQKHAKELGCNGIIAVGGESAGGNLAASICHTAKELKDIEISLQVLYYPWLNLATNYQSAKVYSSGYLLEVPAMHWMRELFLANSAQISNPIANPLLQQDFTKLPPALIFSAQCDPIHDDSERYAEKLSEAGIDVQHIELGGTLHGFFAMPWFYDSAYLSISMVAQEFELKKLVTTRP